MSKTLALLTTLLLVWGAGAVSAQSLTAPFNSNNGQAGNMFDLAVAGSNLNVTSLDINMDAVTDTIEVWFKVGTYVGSETTAANWTLHESIAGITGAGLNVPTALPFTTPLVLSASTTYGIYVTCTTTTALNYTTGTSGTGFTIATNSDLSIIVGAGKGYPFAGTFSPRYWNGTVYYNTGGPAAPTAAPAGGSGFTGNTTAGFDISVAFGATLTNADIQCNDADTANIDATITTGGAAPGITQPSNVTAGAVPFTLSWTGTAGTTAGTYTYTVTLDDGGLQTMFDVRIRLVDPTIPGHLYYQFNEGTGATTANLGNGGTANPTFSATPGWNTTTQQLGAASVSFTGAEELPTGLASAVMNADWTCEFWINTTATLGGVFGDGIFSFIAAVNDGSTFLGGTPNKFLYGDANGAQVESTSDVNDGNWHHIAVSMNATTGVYILYFDGTQEATATVTVGGLGGANITIGGLSDVGGLVGGVDEFRFWDVVRTPAEIAANMNNELNSGDPEINVQESSGPSNWLDGSTQNVGDNVTGVASTGTLIIQNLGTTNNLNITSITITATGVGNCTVSTTALTPASPIGPGGQATFDGSITPTADGPFEATLVIVNDDANEGTYTIVIQGNGVSPEIDVQRPAATSIADGGTDTVAGTVQSAPTALTYTIANDGAATGDLDLTGATPVTVTAGTNCTAVLSSAQPSGPITAGNSVTFDVDVTPGAAGPWSFTISIANNDANEDPYDITVSGTAASAPVPALEVARNTSVVASGGTDTVLGTVASTLANLTYDATNIGSALLTFTGGSPVTATAGTGTPTVAVTQPGSATLALGGGTTTFAIDVTPAAAGAWTVNVSIASNDPASPYTFTISGTAQATAAPEIEVLRNGTTNITDGGTETQTSTGTAAFILNYTIRNTGAQTLNLTGTAGSEVVVSSPSNCAVVVTQPSSTAIAAAGGTVTFSLQVTPIGAGALSFVVSIDNDDADENPFNWTYNGNTGTGTSGGGGGGGDSGGCSTDNSNGLSIFALLGLLSLLAISFRFRGSKA